MNQPRDPNQTQEEHWKRPLSVVGPGADAAVITCYSNRPMNANGASCRGPARELRPQYSTTAIPTAANAGRANPAGPAPFIALSKLRNYMRQHTPLPTPQITNRLTESYAIDSSYSSSSGRISSAAKNTYPHISPSWRAATAAAAAASPIITLVKSEAPTLTDAEKAAAGYEFSRVPHASSDRTISTALTTPSQVRLAQDGRLAQSQQLQQFASAAAPPPAEPHRSLWHSTLPNSGRTTTTSSGGGSSGVGRIVAAANRYGAEYEASGFRAAEQACGQAIDQQEPRRPGDHLVEELHKPQRPQLQPHLRPRHSEPIPRNRQSPSGGAESAAAAAAVVVLNRVVDSCKCITQSQQTDSADRTVSQVPLPKSTKLGRSKQQQQQQQSERLHGARQAQQTEQQQQLQLREVSKTPVSHRSNCTASTNKIHSRRVELLIDNDDSCGSKEGGSGDSAGGKGSSSSGGSGSASNSHQAESATAAADSVRDCFESQPRQPAAGRESVCTEVERKRRLVKTAAPDSCCSKAADAQLRVALSPPSSAAGAQTDTATTSAATIISTNTSDKEHSSHPGNNLITSSADIGDGGVPNEAATIITKSCEGRDARHSVIIAANNMTPGSLMLLQKSDCLEKQQQQQQQLADNIGHSQESIQSSTNSSGNLVISNTPTTTNSIGAPRAAGLTCDRILNSNSQMNPHYNIGSSSNVDQDHLQNSNQNYSAYFQPVDNCAGTTSQQQHHQHQQHQQQLMTLASHEQMYAHVHHQQHQHQHQQQHHQQQQQQQQHSQHQHNLSNHQALYQQVANNVVGVDHGYGHATGVGMQYQGHLSQSNSWSQQPAHLMVDAHQGHLNTAAAARAAAAVVSQTLKTVANQHVQQQHYGSNGFNAATQGVGLMNVAAQHQQQFVANNMTQQQSQLDPSNVTNMHQVVDHQNSLQHDPHQRQAAQQQQLSMQQHTNQMQQFQSLSHSASQQATTRTQLGQQPSSVVTRKYQCKMCPQSFMSKAEMKYHNQNHMREAKPYKCLQCPKAFANSSYLSQHMRIHQGVKPYSCDICTRRFTQLSHLQQHKRTHTGDKPYKCTYLNCTKQFSQLSNLQSHSRCHQLDKPYKCNSCYKCFHDEQSLLEHIPRHLESKHLKKNLCIFCGSSYQQERGLVKHFQQYHTDKSPTLVAAAIAAGTTGNTALISSLIKSSRSAVFATPSSVNSNSSSTSSSLSSNSGLSIHNNISTSTQLHPIHGQSSDRQSINYSTQTAEWIS